MQYDPDNIRVSDMLLAIIAGVVLVGLQLRRQQKAQSESRIISFNTLHRSHVRPVHRMQTESSLPQASDADLIAHAERG